MSTNTTRRRKSLATAGASVFALAMSGFGSFSGPLSAAGASAATPVTLRIGTNDADDQPMAATIEEFAHHVDNLSDGALTIEPVWRAGGEEPHRDWDQVVARMVVSGDLDMGMIPARAWDTEGVTTMRALFAPFLVDSDALVSEIVTTEIAGELLAGLDEIGITGLALLPEDLRHVFAFGEPLLSPDDFAGTTIRAPHSATTWALFEALGATADDLVDDDFVDALATGAVAGAESSFARAAGLPGGQITATGNITLFPNVNSVVINSGAFDGLTDDQQAVLRDAAGMTRDVLLDGLVDDGAAADQFCAGVGDVVLADDDHLAALAAAAQPVHDALMEDGATAALMSRIGELKAQAPAPIPVAACEHTSADQGSDEAVASDPEASSATIPDGTYTRTITSADALQQGLDPGVADQVLGPDGELTIVYEFDVGRWTASGNFYDNDVFEIGDFGTYTFDGDGLLVTTSENSQSRGFVAVIEWTLEDGLLTLALVPVEGQPPYDPVEILMTDGEYAQDP